MENTSKSWMLSRIIWVAGSLFLLNAIYLTLTFLRPTFESIDSTTPMTPFPLWILLLLDVVLGGALIYLRKLTTKSIA